MSNTFHDAVQKQILEVSRIKEEFAAAFIARWGDLDPRNVVLCKRIETTGTRFWFEPRNESSRWLMDQNTELKERAEKAEREVALMEKVVEAARKHSVVTVKIQHQGADEITKALEALDSHHTVTEKTP